MIQAALMGALLFAVQVVLSGLPNIELVSLLLILYTQAVSPKQALAAAFLFALLEGLFYGFGIWWIMYLYIWPVLVLLSWLFRKNRSVWFWTMLSAAFGLSFGALCAIPYAVSGGIAAGISWWISGIPFDIAHCISNAAAMLLLYKPLTAFFQMMKRKQLIV